MSCYCVVSQGRGGASSGSGSLNDLGRNIYHGGRAPDLSRFSSEAREWVSWERRWRVCSKALMFSGVRSGIGD